MLGRKALVTGDDLRARRGAPLTATRWRWRSAARIVLTIRSISCSRRSSSTRAACCCTPNWWRVSDALARHGVTIGPDALAAADPPARRELDDRRTIGTTTDASRGWLFFDLILAHAGVPRSGATAAALAELHAYHSASNLWEYVPPGRHPGARGASRARASARCGVERERHAARPPGLPADDRALRSRAGLRPTRGSRSRTRGSSGSRWSGAARRRRRPSTWATCTTWTSIGARNAGLRGVLLDEADLRPDADCPRVRTLGELVARATAGEFD